MSRIVPLDRSVVWVLAIAFVAAACGDDSPNNPGRDGSLADVEPDGSSGDVVADVDLDEAAGDAEPDGSTADVEPDIGSGDVVADSGTDSPDVTIVDGEAWVTWNAPTTRSDGTDLAGSSIGGYRVHYGAASRGYDASVDVGRATELRITDLSPGRRYYFAVTAYDSSNRESDYSEEVAKDL